MSVLVATALDALENGAVSKSEPQEGELTIDELSAQSRVPSRTIRYYQSKGALPKPTIRGRVAYYGPAHVQRLEVIGKLPQLPGRELRRRS